MPSSVLPAPPLPSVVRPKHRVLAARRSMRSLTPAPSARRSRGNRSDCPTRMRWPDPRRSPIAVALRTKTVCRQVSSANGGEAHRKERAGARSRLSSPCRVAGRQPSDRTTGPWAMRPRPIADPRRNGRLFRAHWWRRRPHPRRLRSARAVALTFVRRI
jgi:hypothetical protein